jgi:hypothetical protein
MTARAPFSLGFKRAALLGGLVLATSAATLLAVRARAAGIPAANALTYTGYLETPDGKPIGDAVKVTINVWDAAKEGTKVCEADAAKLTPVAGRFQVPLPDCQEAVGQSPELWLEAVIDGTSLGRTKLGVVPYAVEANHAATVDAAAEGSPLAMQLAALQADVDATTARLDAPLASKLAKSVGSQVTIDKATYLWVTGTDPTKLAPGRYSTTTTARTWAINSGCTTQCESAILYFAPCMKIGDTITLGDGELVAEPPRITASLPFSVSDSFDLDKETANVQLGLCAKRSALGTGTDAIVANAYSLVMAQPK